MRLIVWTKATATTSAARAAILSFIVVFSVTKALTNYGAGLLADRFGRKHVLVGGWLVAIPVPFMPMWGPSWGGVIAANEYLACSISRSLLRKGATCKAKAHMMNATDAPAKRPPFGDHRAESC